MSNIEKWDRRFLEMAKMVSSWSKDPSTKCGAVIVDNHRRVLSVGYNGFPIRTNDNIEIYNNREEKYRRIVHAEVNAIVLARQSLVGTTLYSYPKGYGPSCERCAVVIIQAGISRVVYFRSEGEDTFSSRWRESALLGLEMFRQANLQIVSYIE
jgi:dCMP deaminase